jgi:hypothetical protein
MRWLSTPSGPYPARRTSGRKASGDAIRRYGTSSRRNRSFRLQRSQPMDRLLRVVLQKLIRTGNLRLTTARGSTFTFGDKIGIPVAIRFITRAAQRGVLIDPELRFGEWMAASSSSRARSPTCSPLCSAKRLALHSYANCKPRPLYGSQEKLSAVTPMCQLRAHGVD